MTLHVPGTDTMGRDVMEGTNGSKSVLYMITAAVLAAISGILSAFLFLGYLSAGEMTGLVLATLSYLLLAGAAFRYRRNPSEIKGAVLLVTVMRALVLAINIWNLVFFVNNVHSISGSLAKRDFIEPVGNLLIFAVFLIFAMILSGKIRTKVPGSLLLVTLFLFEIARLIFVYRTRDFDMNPFSRGNFWESVFFYHLPILLIAVSVAFLLMAVTVIKKSRKSTGKLS